MTSETRLRSVAALASVVSVAPLAILCRHDLMHSKPYKLTFSPLAGALSALGPWLLVLIFLAALFVVVIVHERAVVISPILAVVVAAGIALAAVQATFGAVQYGLSDEPVGHDFGIGTVAGAFTALVSRECLRGIGIAAAGVAMLAYLNWSTRRAS